MNRWVPLLVVLNGAMVGAIIGMVLAFARLVPALKATRHYALLLADTEKVDPVVRQMARDSVSRADRALGWHPVSTDE